jgi:nucleoid DNA-binding protein
MIYCFYSSSKLRGLGSYHSQKPDPPLPQHTPTTGNPVHIPEKKILHFRTSLQIRRRLNPSKPGTRKTAKNKKPSA